jgi:hypothetical protein
MFQIIHYVICYFIFQTNSFQITIFKKKMRSPTTKNMGLLYEKTYLVWAFNHLVWMEECQYNSCCK